MSQTVPTVSPARVQEDHLSYTRVTLVSHGNNYEDPSNHVLSIGAVRLSICVKLLDKFEFTISLRNASRAELSLKTASVPRSLQDFGLSHGQADGQ